MDESLKKLLSNWKLKADNDIKSIKTLLAGDEIITDSICYHAQQAAEKYLKLFLVFHDISPEKTHKIELLLKKCSDIDAEFLQLRHTDILSEYAIELRYPDNFYIPTIEEAKEAFALSIEIRDVVLKKITFKQ